MSLAKATAARVWSRYVAIGDSFSEGLCDVDPDDPDRFVGWADRLAGHLAGIAAAQGGTLEYANLAVRGRLLADVVGPQLGPRPVFRPDLVSIVGGGNDILRNHADLDLLSERLERPRCEDPRDRRRRALGDRRRHPGRGAHQGTAIEGVAYPPTLGHRQPAPLPRHRPVDPRLLRDWRMWSEDRIHMSPEGHRRVALAALDALGHPTDVADWTTPLPPADRAARQDELLGHAQWARTYAGPWVQRRVRGRSSGDALSAKRPRLEHFRDPDGEPTHQALPEG